MICKHPYIYLEYEEKWSAGKQIALISKSFCRDCDVLIEIWTHLNEHGSYSHKLGVDREPAEENYVLETRKTIATGVNTSYKWEGDTVVIEPQYDENCGERFSDFSMKWYAIKKETFSKTYEEYKQEQENESNQSQTPP